MAPRRRTFTRNRMSRDQMETIISYMEQHTLFARGQITKLGPQGHIKFKGMWSKLTNMLNGMGPCITDVKGWQDKWTRMRLLAKSQKAQFYKALNKTGHDNPTVLLSPYNERISVIFGKYGTGVNIGQELGFSKCMWVERSRGDNELDCFGDFDPRDCSQVFLQFKVVPDHLHSMLQKFHQNCTSIFQEMQRKSKGGKLAMKPTQTQMDKLVELVERHLEIALDQPGDDSNSATWDLVALLLNKEDGINKSGKLWRRTWHDLINTAKQNVSLAEYGYRQTPLSAHHVKALQILSLATEQARLASLRGNPQLCLRGNPQQSEGFDHMSESLSAIKRPRSSYSPLDLDRPSSGHGSLVHDQPSTSSGYRGARASNTRNRIIHRSSVPWTQTSSSSEYSTSTAAAAGATVTATAAAAGTTVTTTTAASATETATAAGGTAAEKSSAFLKAFDNKFKELIDILAAQFISCFEQQNVVVQECFAKQNEIIIKMLSNQVVDCNEPMGEEDNNGNAEDRNEIALDPTDEAETEYTASGDFQNLIDDDSYHDYAYETLDDDE